jgi:hypothetical protein
LNVELLQQIRTLDATMSVERINSFLVAVLVFLSGASVFGHTPLACADYYRYKDNKGIICITNSLSAIPLKYRSTMKVIHDNGPRLPEKGSQTLTLQGGASGAQEPTVVGHDPQTITPSQSNSRIEQLLERFPLIKLLTIIAGIITVLLITLKLTSLIPSPQLARLINIAFFLGLFVFAYKLYSDYLVSNYFTIKGKILEIVSKARVQEAPETPGESAVK